ncbi:MAG TPA: glycosyltransferase family 2 protein [Anaerolineae bacterium]
MDELASVIVINWNGRRYLEDCLTALRAQTYPKREVILVDNGSTDGSIEYVTAAFPETRIVRCEQNIGFAAANNLGFAAARGAYIATLNNDTRADPTWLADLVQAMQTKADIGMCASKMVLWSDPTIIDSAGIAFSWSGVAWDRYGGMPDEASESTPVDIFGPCAGAALYKRELIERLGGYEGRFFIYLEDVDLAWRAQVAGWRCLYVPTARVIHVHSGTTVEGSSSKNFNLGRNKVWLLYRNLPRKPGWLALVALYDLMAIAFSIYRYRNLQAIRGRLAGLRGIDQAMRAARQQIQAGALPQNRDWQKRLSPLEAPWQVARRFDYLKPIQPV